MPLLTELYRPSLMLLTDLYQLTMAAAAHASGAARLGLFHGGIKRFLNPHRYPVGLERTLHERRTELVLAARERH